MTFVHEVVNQQRNMAASFDAHLSDLDRLHAQRMASQGHETRAELERLANLQAESEKKARMAETALSAFRDIQDEDRLRLARIAERQGEVHNHVGQSVVNNTTVVDNTNQHNQVLQLVHAHGHNFGEFMRQQNMNQEEMMRLIHEHVRRNPALLSISYRVKGRHLWTLRLSLVVVGLLLLPLLLARGKLRSPTRSRNEILGPSS